MARNSKNYDLSDLAGPSQNYDLTDLSTPDKAPEYDLSDISAQPAGNLATDVAKAVPRGWEYSMAGLGRGISAAGEQMTEAAVSPIGTRRIPLPGPFGGAVTLKWKKPKIQQKIDVAVGKLGTFFQSYGQEVKKFYQDNAAKGWEAPDPAIMLGWRHPVRKAVTLAAENLPALGVAAATTAVTKSPMAGAATFFPQAYGEMYWEARDAGKSPESAAKYALLNAAAQVGLESMTLGQWMRGGNIAKRIVRTAISEGIVEEGTQQLVTNGLKVIGWKKPKDLNEFINIMLDGMAESIVAGMLSGGVLGAAGSPSIGDRVSDHVDLWVEKNGERYAKEHHLSKEKAQQIFEATKTELTKQAEDIAAKTQPPEESFSMAGETNVPAEPGKYSIPDFKSTEEAWLFGWENKDNPEVLEALRKKREEIQAESHRLMALENSTNEQQQEAFRLAQISQFPREAIEAATGKVDISEIEKIHKRSATEPLAAEGEVSPVSSEPPYIPPGVTPPGPAATPQQQKEFKLYEEMLAFKKEVGGVLGERYVKPGTIGTYYPASQSVRTRAINDIFTTVHELFHHVSITNKVMKKIYTSIGEEGKRAYYDPAFKDIRNQIAKIYFEQYGGATINAPMYKMMEEGGAMLFQKYVENPDFVKKTYPEAVKEFLTPAGKFYDPKVGSMLARARKIYLEYSALDPLNKINARMTNKDIPVDAESFMALRDKLTETFFDRFYLAEKLGKEAGVKFTLQDPQIWFRLSSMMKHLSFGNVQKGKGFWTLNLRTGSMEQVSARNWGDLIDDLNTQGILIPFSNWLIARDQYFEYQKLDQLRSDALAETNKDKKYKLIKELQEQSVYLKKQGWARAEIESGYLDNKDRFEKFGKEFTQYTRASLTLMYQAGLLTHKQYTDLMSKESYAPMKRFIYDEILGPESERIGEIKIGGTKISSMMGRSGGMQTIINPIYQAVVDMGEIYNKSMKQRSINSVLRLAPHFPKLFLQRELITHVDKETGALSYPQEKDKNIIMLRLSGKRVPFLVNQDIRKFIEEYMTPVQISVMEKVGNFSARLFTKGTTSMYPFFAFNNFIQDQLFALGNTRTNMVPIYDAAKLLHRALLKKDPKIASLWERYNLMGGQNMTLMQNVQRMSPENFFKFVTHEKNAIEQIADGLETFTDFFALPVQTSELMTRFAEFAKAVETGDPEIVALEKAGRVSGPFHHKGTWGGRVGVGIVDQIPYFNASMQFLGEQFEGLTSNDPARQERAQFVALGVAAVMIAAMVNAYRNGTDEQKRLLRDLNPQEQSRYLFFPDPNGKNLIRIRVPDMAGSAAAVINMMILEMIDEKSRYDTFDFLNAATAFVPDQMNPLSGPRLLFAWIPHLLKVPIELTANIRTFPNIRPIESQGQMYREPKHRAYPTTSQLAKDIGKQFNLSPIKIDYLIQGYLGRVVKLPTWIYEKVRGGQAKISFNPFVRRWYFESSQILQDYYTKSKEVNQKYNTLQHKFELVPAEEAAQIRREHKKVLRINRMLEDYSKRTKDMELIHEDKLPAYKQQWIETQRARILTAVEDILNPTDVTREEGE